MPAAIDITGEKFWRLTAISAIPNSRPRKWKFRCDCGNTIARSAGQVRYGATKSCGCLRQETTATRKSVDLTGRQFDRLTVLSKRPERNKHGCVVWLCVCSCGNQTQAVTSTLTKGAKRSCGCLRREMIRELGASSRLENPYSRTSEYRSRLRARLRENPQIAMGERISRMLCWALASVGAVKRGSTFDTLGYTPAELKEHIERQFLPGMSWDNRSEWQIDHIIPISTAKTEDDVIALNQLTNLRPLWAAENNKKRDRIETLL